MKKLLILLLLAALLTGCAPAVTEPASEPCLFVHFIDVGQADCTLLKCGDTEILIDAGNPANGPQVVSYLNRLGVEDLELVIATHPHADHIGGLSYVLRSFPVEQIWTNGVSYDTSVANALQQQISKLQLEHRQPQPGETVSYGPLELTVLGPLRTDYNDLNDTSIVVMAEFLDKRFLMTGDMETYAESELLIQEADLKADVLKVGHHGSYSSSSDPFLEAVDPDYGFIPVGRDNDYGHPHAAAMKRLLNAQITLFRADTMGTVIAATNGDSLAFFWEYGHILPVR